METVTAKKKIADMLEEFGFSVASQKIKEVAALKRKLALAYEHYRVVKPGKINEFNERLKRDTIKGQEPYNARWKTLVFCKVQQYPNCPPTSVLESMSVAVGRKCFDYFEVALIEDVNDPLLFGCINDCEDRFFIDQWDTDVSITDLLKDNEG